VIFVCFMNIKSRILINKANKSYTIKGFKNENVLNSNTSGETPGGTEAIGWL
jgi:hypothetical protein